MERMRVHGPSARQGLLGLAAVAGIVVVVLVIRLGTPERRARGPFGAQRESGPAGRETGWSSNGPMGRTDGTGPARDGVSTAPILSSSGPAHDTLEADISASQERALEDFGLPVPSQLPPEQIAQAIEYFRQQHQNWLQIKDGTAQYTVTRRAGEKDKAAGEAQVYQRGRLEFRVMPVEDRTPQRSPVNIQIHLINSAGLHFLKEDAFDAASPAWRWREGEPCDAQNNKARTDFDTGLLFLPIDFLVKTYASEGPGNRYTEAEGRFFAERGLPRRLSTTEETETLFGGEPQYLFLASPAIVDARYWFSARNGDLRQIDIMTKSGDVTVSFRYEDYHHQEGQDTALPRRLTRIHRSPRGSGSDEWEYTIELQEIRLNEGLAPQRFTPPL